MDLPDGAVNLNLSPAAVAAAQEGMWRVVNTVGGSGNVLFQPNLEISGKTGTAQASPFWVPEVDKSGKKLYFGTVERRRYLEPSTTAHPNPEAPWYLGFDEKGSAVPELKHAWFIGYAPSHHPQVAFAVMVEYGGSGGPSAGAIAHHVIDACVEHGYVPLDTEVHELRNESKSQHSPAN
jgi:cell division protein FtsI/penicillin-binding protein 2